MPAPKVRNAVFGHLRGIRPEGPRLHRGSCTGPSYDFDFLAVVARSVPELETIRVAYPRRFKTQPNTLSRRREVVECAEGVARTLGWEWSDEELELLAEFAGDSIGAESGISATPAAPRPNLAPARSQ